MVVYQKWCWIVMVSNRQYRDVWKPTKMPVRGVAVTTSKRMAQRFKGSNGIGARNAASSFCLPWTIVIAPVFRCFVNWLCRWHWMVLASEIPLVCCKSVRLRCSKFCVNVPIKLQSQHFQPQSSTWKWMSSGRLCSVKSNKTGSGTPWIATTGKLSPSF